MFGTHSLILSADRAAVWDTDHLSFTYDNQLIHLDEGHLSTWSAGALQVERTTGLNSVTVTLPKVFEIMATGSPSRSKNTGSTNTEFRPMIAFRPSRCSSSSLGTKGVLGQTYRPDFKNPVKRGVPMPIMSGEDTYVTIRSCQPAASPWNSYYGWGFTPPQDQKNLKNP